MPESQIDEKIVNKYYEAVYSSWLGNSKKELDDFKKEYPLEFKLISAMYRKRVALRKTIEILEMVRHLSNQDIYWFTLTFSSDKDNVLIDTKRKYATRFLNDLCDYYIMVEEYGTINERYHIHGFLVFKDSKSFNDFVLWPHRQNIKKLSNDLTKCRRVQYLTNYATKSVPRLRRSKNLSSLYTLSCKLGSLKNTFPSLYSDKLNCAIAKQILLN